MNKPIYEKQTQEQRRKANAKALLLLYRNDVLTLTEYVSACRARGCDVLVDIDHEKRFNTRP